MAVVDFLKKTKQTENHANLLSRHYIVYINQRISISKEQQFRRGDCTGENGRERGKFGARRRDRLKKNLKCG